MSEKSDLNQFQPHLLDKALEITKGHDSTIRLFEVGAIYVSLLLSEWLTEDENASLAYHIAMIVADLSDDPRFIH